MGRRDKWQMPKMPKIKDVVHCKKPSTKKQITNNIENPNYNDPNPDKPELKIEDCKLKIYGCRFAPS